MNTHTLMMSMILGWCFATAVPAATNAPVLAAKGDLDGDGFGDVIIQHRATGYAAAVGMVSNDVVWAGYLGGGFDIDPFRLVGTLDLDADGTEDALWRYGETDTYVWTILDRTNVVATETLFDEATFDGWEVLTTADFNNDGYGDLLVRHRQYQVWAVAFLEDFEMTEVVFVEDLGAYAAWSVAGAGDIDGDGNPDVLVHQERTGQVAILWMDGAEYLDASPIQGEESESLWPWRPGGLTDVDGNGQSAIIMQLGGTAYYEVYRAVAEDDQWIFEAEPLGGFTAGIGDWRVIGPR